MSSTSPGAMFASWTTARSTVGAIKVQGQNASEQGEGGKGCIWECNKGASVCVSVFVCVCVCACLCGYSPASNKSLEGVSRKPPRFALQIAVRLQLRITMSSSSLLSAAPATKKEENSCVCLDLWAPPFARPHTPTTHLRCAPAALLLAPSQVLIICWCGGEKSARLI